jgi:hypothetical protein
MTQAAHRETHRSRARRAAGLALTLGLMLVATCTVVTGRHAHAAANELLHDAGSQLLAYTDPYAAGDEGTRTLLLNGATLEMRTGSATGDVATVLAAYEMRCREWIPQLGTDVAGALPDFSRVVRLATEESGFLGCLRKGEARIATSDLLERFERFARDGDLSVLGTLEVAWVIRTTRGTRYVVVRSVGELPLFRMFPGERDAPGIDVPGAPELPRSRRLVSIWQTGEAPMLASYLSELAPNSFVQRYAGDLRRAGFELRVSPRDDARGRLLHAARNPKHIAQGEDLLIIVGSDDASGSLVTVAPVTDRSAR